MVSVSYIHTCTSSIQAKTKYTYKRVWLCLLHATTTHKFIPTGGAACYPLAPPLHTGSIHPQPLTCLPHCEVHIVQYNLQQAGGELGNTTHLQHREGREVGGGGRSQRREEGLEYTELYSLDVCA